MKRLLVLLPEGSKLLVLNLSSHVITFRGTNRVSTLMRVGIRLLGYVSIRHPRDSRPSTIDGTRECYCIDAFWLRRNMEVATSLYF